MTHAHLAFELDGFEDPDETLAENINGIHGKALAKHVAHALSIRGYTVSENWPEDHGWDFEASKDDRSYLLACSVIPSEVDCPDQLRNEAHITWSRSRSFLDALMGRNALSLQDESIADLREIAFKLDGQTQPQINLT